METRADWRLVLCDERPEVLEAWRLQFAEVPGTEIVEGDPLAAAADALLLPGNSFGFLDVGLELEVFETYGIAVQDALRKKIREDFFGELLVGQAIALGPPDAPRALVYAPVWRVPCPLEGTANVYLAVRGALLALRGGTPGGTPKRLVVPAIGVGPPGGLHPGISARQTRYAYEVVCGLRGFGDKNLSQAARRHKKLLSVPGSLRREDSEEA